MLYKHCARHVIEYLLGTLCKQMDEPSPLEDCNHSTEQAFVDNRSILETNNKHGSNATSTHAQCRSRGVQTGKRLSASTPRKTCLRRKLHAAIVNTSRFKHTYLRLQQKYKEKMSKCVPNVKAVIQGVAKYLSGDCLNFVTHQLKMSDRHPKGRRYSIDIRLQALAIYNSGPKAYKYLAKIFALPSKASLCKWLQSMKCTPGFHDETFSALKERMKYMPLHDRACSLIIDEISLKCNLQYDRHADHVVGYDDKGPGFCRSQAKATSALVFMLRGTATNWSQPVGYVFTSSACKASDIKQLLLRCLSECVKTGAIVNVVISDQGPNFQQLTNLLGVTIEKPYFMYEDRKYFYMYDTPHLMKSVRNNLEKHNISFDKNKTATWDVIKNCYEIDKKQRFRLVPKLTDNHIYLPQFTRMKVKYATQVFSKSLAAALETHASILGKLSLQTAEFLAKFDDIFDTMNSCCRHAMKPLQSAISDDSNHLAFIKRSIKWIRKTKVTDKTNKDITNIVKCLKGWQLSLNVIKHLWPVLKHKCGFKFLLTRRLNTDPLENLFSSIRQRGGNCTTPTPWNFARIYKQVSCNRLLTPSTHANCEIDVTQVLQAMCARANNARQSVLRVSRPVNKDVPTAVTKNTVSKTDTFRTSLLPYDEMNQLEDNAIHYVAGYLLRKLELWHSCDACHGIFNAGYAGYGKRNETFTKLKRYNDKNGLVNVSQAFHFYIVRLEKALQNVIKEHIHEHGICSQALEQLTLVTVPTRCIGFPKIKFLQFFIRLRLYYILKYENALTDKKPRSTVKKSSRQLKIYKQFAHK